MNYALRITNYELKNINIDIPRPVREILDTLHGAGFEACIVGGCVRDVILGRRPEDWDITTQALPYQVKSLFKSTADTGLEHGTVMVIKGGAGYEVTTFRIDGKYLDGRHPESVEFTPSLEEDLKRRDFTINAFAYSPDKGVTDLFDGISDLNNGLIRCVGEAERRFGEDALRIMRAVRFSAQLSFKIEEKTAKAIEKFAPKLAQVSTERIRVEFEKTLLSDNPEYVCLYRDYGLAPYIFPDVYEKCFGDDEAHLLKNIKSEEKEELKYLRLAAFFDKLSGEDAGKVLKRFTYDNRTKETVSCILKFKDYFVSEDFPAVKRAMRDMGADVFAMVQKLKIAQAKTAGKDPAHYIKLLEIMQEVIDSGEAYTVPMLAVNGADLIKAGIPQGTQVGQTLNEILELVTDNPGINKKEEILKILKVKSNNFY